MLTTNKNSQFKQRLKQQANHTALAQLELLLSVLYHQPKYYFPILDLHGRSKSEICLPIQRVIANS